MVNNMASRLHTLLLGSNAKKGDATMAAQNYTFQDSPKVGATDLFAEISDADMLALAEQFNEIEPSAGMIVPAPVMADAVEAFDYAAQFDAMISLLLLAGIFFLTLPFLRRFVSRLDTRWD